MRVVQQIGIIDNGNKLLAFKLKQNYPNPFNPTTSIEYTLTKISDVRLTIFNLQGEEVAKLVEGRFNAGEYSVEWNASNIPSGIYFYRLHTGEYVQTKKMVLLK